MADTASNLKTLVKTTIDSAEGYERAAETAEAAHLKSVLREQAQKRRQLVTQLNQELVRIGGEAQKSGSATGSAHHVWTRMTEAFKDADKGAAERVEEGEDYIEEKFREALEDKNWDPRTREVLERAHGQIKEGERLGDKLEEQYD